MNIATIELSELVTGNIVRVTPMRHYGTEECAGEQPWNAEVQEVDVEGDKVCISQKASNEGRWIERDRVTANGQDVCLRFKDPRDGSWMKVVNSNPLAQAAMRAEARSLQINELIALGRKVAKVSYKDRVELSNKICNLALDLGINND